MKKEEFKSKIINGVLCGDFRNEEDELVLFDVKTDYRERFLTINNVEEEVEKLQFIYNVENIEFVISETTYEKEEFSSIIKLDTTLTIFFEDLKDIYIPIQKITITCFIDEDNLSLLNIGK